jgi:prepilin-type processing-associated H-X9-DG protein
MTLLPVSLILGQDTITPYKQVGCDGLTLYRHSEGVNITFYDGHAEYRKKEKVFSRDAWDAGTHGCWTGAGGVTPQDWPEWMQGFKDY